MTNRQEADFWVTFGSNAREFSAQLPKNLEGARKEIADLKKEIATLFDEAAQTNPSLGQGLIKELQAANREIAGLSTGIKRMAGELDVVVGKLRNLKIEPGAGGGGGRSAAGGVSAATVEAAANKAAQTAINEYIKAQETQAKSAGETAQAAKRGAASGAKAARDVSASVAAGETADRERIAAENEIAKQKRRAADDARRATRQQAQAAAAAPPVTPPAPAPVAPRAPQRPAEAPRPTDRSREAAERFVAGLSGQQILDKLASQNAGDVQGLSQTLGFSGRGSPKTLANRIAKTYQNFAVEAAQAVEKSVEQAVASAPKTSNAVRVDVEAALAGLNEKALHAAVQQMNELFGTSVNIRTPKTDQRRNMGTIVRDAVRALENVADEQVNALVQGLEQARQQVAAAGAGAGKTYRGGPGGTYTARSAAEWEAYSKEAGFAGTVEKMGGLPALQGAGYAPITLTPGSSKLQASLWPALERLQQTHPEVAADTAKADTSRKRTAKAAKRIAQAEESSAKSTEQLAVATEQQAAVLEAEVAETRAAGTMSLADVRAQIQERVQRQRETELLDRNQKSRKQIDKIKDPAERETAIRQWETRQRQTASYESQALAATVIPYEGLSARGSLDLVRTRLLNDETAGLPDEEAIAAARRIDYATSQQRMQGLMSTGGRSKKRTSVGTMIDTEYAGYVQSAQEAAAAHTPIGEFQRIRQEGGLGRSEDAIAAYRELIQRAGEASIPLRDIESDLRANARAGGQYRSAERGAEPIRRANMEEVLSSGGIYGGDDLDPRGRGRSIGMAHEAALIDNQVLDARRKIDTAKRQRSVISFEIGSLKYQRSQQSDPDLKAGYTEQIDQLIADSKALSTQINTAYEEMKAAQAKWDEFAQFTPSVGPGGGTKTAGAHTLPGPTGSIIPTPSGTKRGGDSTVGGVDEELRQRLIGGYYTGYTEEQMRAKPFADLRAEAAGVGIRGRSRDALIAQLLERYPAGAANQEFGARQAGVFQAAGPARATYEQTIQQGALEFLQQNPNWDPFAKLGTPQGKRNNKGPSTRRAISEVDKAIEYWDKLAVELNNYIASIREEIVAAGGQARAPLEMIDRLGAANQMAVEKFGPNARDFMEGASAREQYRAATMAADARPGSRVQRQTSREEMFFASYGALHDRRLGLVAPHTDQGKTAIGGSDWRLRAGQVTGGFENYVSPLMRGDLDRTQMRKLRQATDMAAGTGDALHNFITTSLPEDFSGDVETLPQALRVELQRLRKAAQSARTRLDKLMNDYAAINQGDYVQDAEPTAQEKADRIKEQTATGEAERAQRGTMSVSKRRDTEGKLEALDSQRRAIAQYDAYLQGENEIPPTAAARQHIGELLGVAPTGFLPGSKGRHELEIEREGIKNAVERGQYKDNPGDAEARLAEIKRSLEAPGYEPDAFTAEQIAEARRKVEKSRAGVAKTLQNDAYAHYVNAGNVEGEAPPPAIAARRAAAATTTTPVEGERVVDRIGTGSSVTPETVREVTGTAPLGDVSARAADRMIAAIEKLEAVIQKLYDRFRPGQPLPEGMQPAAGGSGGRGGGTRRPRAAAAAAEPPDDSVVSQLAAQAAESPVERMSRGERERRAYEEAQRTASARRREILAGLPMPNPNDPNDVRANVRGLVSQAILPGVSSDERLDLLTQAGTSMRRQYGYRYKSEIPQLAEVGGLSREEKGVLDVRVSAAAKAYTQAAEAAKRMRAVEEEEALAARNVAETQSQVEHALKIVTARTGETIQVVQRYIAIQRERALTDEESAGLHEARVRAIAQMEADLTRINPDTRRPLLNQERRVPVERAALGVSGPERNVYLREANMRNDVQTVANAGVDEATAQGGKLRRAMSAMFGVNNSFGGRAIAGAGTAVVRTFSYGAVFGVVNEMQKIFRTSIETEAEFVRISDALNATGRSAGNLRSSLQSISSDLATPLEEVYVTASQLTGVFNNTTDVEFATRAVEQLKLISRGALNSQEAISSLQAVTSAFGLTGSQAFQQVVDKATAIQNFTGANVEQLLEGAGGIAPQARAFHLTQDQALLYPGLIAQRTNQSGTAAAEQLSRIFESLAAPAASQFLTRRGFATETQVRGSQFGEIMQNLIHQRATGGLTDNDLVALERLVGARQARPLAAAIGTREQAQTTERGASAADDSAGAGQQRVRQLMGQLNRQLQQLSVNLTNIGAALVRSGFLVGLQHAVALANVLLSTAGKIGDVFAELGKIRGASFLGHMLVEAGTLYVVSKLIGATFRSISEYTSRVLKPNDEAAASRGIRAVTPLDANGYPASLGYGGLRDDRAAARAAVINEQNALRADVQGQLANQSRYSFFRNPTQGIVAGVGTLGARAFDTPFIRLGNVLQRAGTEGTRFGNITTTLGTRLSGVGRSLTQLSTSSQVLSGRLAEVAAQENMLGRVSRSLSSIGNAALIAGPAFLIGYQTLQDMHRQAQDFLKAQFPNAFPDTNQGNVGQSQDERDQKTATAKALADASGKQHSILGRVSAFGGGVLHSIAGTATLGLTDQFDKAGQDFNEFAGSFVGDVNTIGGTSRGAQPLNDEAVKVYDVGIAAFRGLRNRTKSIDDINKDFDAEAKSIANNKHLSDMQKTVAGAELKRIQRQVQNAYLAIQQHLEGISVLNTMTAEQAGSFGEIIQTGMSLTQAQRRNGIGSSLYKTFTDQHLVAEGSDASYYLAALYGGSGAVADPAIHHYGIMPGGPHNIGPQDYTTLAPPSTSQRREASLLKGIDPNSFAGQQALEGKLAGTLETQAIPEMRKALDADKNNPQQYAEDLAKFKSLIDFDGQIRLQIAQESVQAATELSQILLGQGDNAGAISALNQAIAAQQKNLKNAKTASEKFAIMIDIAQKQRSVADIAAAPGIAAANLAGANATNPGAQASATASGAQQQLNELLSLRAKGKGGVTDADITNARAAVASANQAIVSNSESITESVAALLQAETLDPFRKVQESIDELNRQIAYYRARGDTAKVNELSAQLAQATQSAADLAADAAQAQTGLLIAIATAAGHVVQAARLGLRQALEAYHKALKDNGGNKNAPDVKNAYAAVIAARANIRDTWLQDREDDLKFQYDMGKISLQSYEAQLKQLLQRKNLTKKQRQEIESTLHDLANQSEGMWNFGDIKMPTPYEVRRLITAGRDPGRYITDDASSVQAGRDHHRGRTPASVGATSAGAAAAVATPNHTYNTTNHVSINGADMDRVRAYIASILGPQAIQRSAPHNRKG